MGRELLKLSFLFKAWSLGKIEQLCQRSRFHFFHHVRAVYLYGAGAQMERLGDHFVRFSCDDQVIHLLFPAR